MNEKTFKKLEYDKIIGFLADECVSAPGRERAEKLMPHRERVIVEGWQKETTEARNILVYLPNFCLFRTAGGRQIIHYVSQATY